MKTNKERSKIILQKFKEENNVAKETVTQEQTVTQKKRFSWNWKSIISVCSACVMVLTLGLGLGLGLGLNGRTENPNQNLSAYNFDNSQITNFEDYKAIGSGSLGGVDIATGASVSIQSNGNHYGHRLIGVKHNGHVEEIKIKKDKHEKEEPIELYVSCIYSLNNFTVVNFKNSKNTETRIWMNKQEDNGVVMPIIVLIDNNTGKLYSLEKLVKEKHWIYYLYINDFFDVYPDSNVDLCESENSFFFKLEANHVGKYYKATVVDGKLEVKEIIDMSNFVDFENLIVDKYGNVFLGQRSGQLTEETSTFYASYYVTTGGEMKQLNVSVNRALNGIVYTSDKTKQFNAQGELIDNSFENCDFYQKRANLIKRVGNIEYYFGTRQDPYYYSKKDTIYKVTWKNDVEFDVEENVLTDFEEDYVVTADKIFFRNETKIYSVDIVTGQKEDLTSEYFFTSIETDNLGNVSFVGLDSSMQNVTGLIRNDGTVETSVTASEYKVYYIKALN